MNIIIPLLAIIVLIIIHELGHFFAAKLVGVKVLEFSIGFPPRLVSKEVGGTKVSLGALLLGGFVKLKGDAADSEDFSKDSLSGTTHGRKLIILIAGVLMNLIAAWAVISLLFVRGVNLPVDSLPQNLEARYSENIPTLSFGYIAEGTPAENAKLPVGQKITRIGTKDTQIDLPKQEDFMTLASTGETLVITFNGNEDYVVTPEKLGDNYRVGVVLAEDVFVKNTLGAGILHAGAYTLHLTRETLTGIATVLYNIVAPQKLEYQSAEGMDASSLSGPIGIVRTLGSTLDQGYSLFLILVAIISINLAVLNILPLPILDGGRILTVIIEAIRGKRVSTKTHTILNTIGIVVILALMLVGILNDIS